VLANGSRGTAPTDPGQGALGVSPGLSWWLGLRISVSAIRIHPLLREKGEKVIENLGRSVPKTGKNDQPKAALGGLSGLVVIDEVQRRPDLFPVLRVLVDRADSGARFLVLGSASPNLLRQTSETLAGRVGALLVIVELIVTCDRSAGWVERLDMNAPATRSTSWQDGMSPLRITLLAVNALCFGGCVVLLAVGTASGPLLLLTIGTGLSLGAGVAGAITALRKQSSRR
jgi:hypothetical protein